MVKELVRLEVQKSNGIFYYTGHMRERGEWIDIETIKNESLSFRKEQINSIRKMKDKAVPA